MTEPRESRTVPRAAELNRIKEVPTVERTERTLPAVLSIALTLAGLALMLTTHDATVHLLAACVVASETAKEASR
jgi:hypothetical protein